MNYQAVTTQNPTSGPSSHAPKIRTRGTAPLNRAAILAKLADGRPLTLDEIAFMAELSMNTILRAAKEGKLKTTKFGKNILCRPMSHDKCSICQMRQK